MISIDLAKIGMPKDKRTGDPKITKPNWLMIHERATGKKFSMFFAKKSDMVEPVCELIQKWKNENKPVRRIRCDNAGENNTLEKRLKSSDWKMGDIQFEYTSRNTPQQNSRVEKGFETIVNRGRAMMVAANIPENRRYMFTREACTTATKLDGLTVVKYKGEKKTRDEHWGQEMPTYVKKMIPWGWAGAVKTKLTHSAKLKNRGTIMMFVGYPDNHAGDSYRMYNEKTKKVVTTRDILWLNRMFYNKEGKPYHEVDEDEDEEEEYDISDSESEDGDDEIGGHDNTEPQNQNAISPAQASQNTTESNRTEIDESNIITESSTTRTSSRTRSGRLTNKPENFSYEK